MPFSDWIRQKLPGSYPDYDDDPSQKTLQSESCPDDERPQISNDRRHVQKYRNPQKQCKDLGRMLEESNKQREHLERQLDSHKHKIQDLNKKLGSCKEAVKASRMGQLCAEERFRRQTQILKECSTALDASLEENDSLIIQQATLQRWTERLDDDEARQITAQLYYDLEIWVKRHFPHLFSANKASHANPDSPSAYENGCLDTFYNAYTVVAYCVFDIFLTRTMVGIGDPDLGKKVSMLDEKVRMECPAHVSQHWRSAMSTATFSIAAGDLDSECKRLALALDWHVQLLSGEPHGPIGGLAELLGQFLKLKFRLDSQADLYTFVMPNSGTPFSEKDMTSFTGQFSENGSVQYCLSPAMFKKSTGCDPILIKKAIVIVDMDWQHSSGW